MSSHLLWSSILIPFWQTSEGIRLKEEAEKALTGTQFAPPKQLLYRALELTSFEDIRVVILGQDPYHTPGVANGLAFSTEKHQKLPPSLANIFRELKNDMNIDRHSGDLSDWAAQGVLLLNTIFSVEIGSPASHRHLGWQHLSDYIIQEISQKKDGVVFVLWGSYAQGKIRLIDQNKHFVLTSVHPSPLSVYRGFFGSKPFSQINTILKKQGKTEILWG